MTDDELQRAIDRAAKQGAEEALRNIGLNDEDAYQDMHELRLLLDSWRVTKKTVATTFIKFVTTLVLGGVVAVLWMQEKNIGG